MSARTRWHERMASPSTLWLALALGAALRALHLVAIQRSPFSDNAILDHQSYDRWAMRIAQGDLVGQGVFWVDPLYSYVLALLYAIFGHHYLVVRVAQLAAGLGIIALTGALARRISSSAAIGNGAALLAAVYIPLIHNETQLEKATLSTLLATGALVAFLTPSRRGALVAGALLGLAVLTRGNCLLMIPSGALAMLLAPVADDEPRLGRVSREAVARTLRFAGSALLVVGVLTTRNLLVAHEPMPTTANGGQNFYIGQQRTNVVGTYAAPPFVRPDPEHEQLDFRAEGERRTGHAMSDAELSAYWAGQGLLEVKADPAGALRRSLRKLRLAFLDFEMPDNDDLALAARWSPVLRLPFASMGFIAPLALLGVIGWWRRSRTARIVAGAVAIYVGTLVLFFVVGRFRILMVPPLIALAACGAAWLLELAPDRRRLGGAGVVLAAGLLLCFWEPAWVEAQRVSSLAIAYNNIGSQLVAAGRLDEAIEAYEHAIALRPEAVIGAMRTLGELYLRAGRYDDAERVMRLVLVYKPSSAQGHAALARLEAARGKPAPAVGTNAGTASDLYAQSRAARAAGRWPEAISSLQQAIHAGAYDENAHYLLGQLMEQHASADEMIAYFSSTKAADPKPQTSLYFWAIGLERKGDVDGAIAKWKEALAVDPAHEMSELRWCQALAKRGSPAAALPHCDHAVDIYPDLRTAHEERARILDALGRKPEAEAARAAAAHTDPATKKQYLYWGRALIKAGRPDLAVPELEKAIASAPGDEEARRLLEQARAAGTSHATTTTQDRTRLDARTRVTLEQALRGVPAGTPAWIQSTAGDAASGELASELAAELALAGWQVRSLGSTDVRVKPGLFIFAADESPPGYVGVLERALTAAGLSPQLMSGYRAFYDSMTRDKPGFRGFPMEPEQTFWLIVGRSP